jgi:hypothetical protein
LGNKWWSLQEGKAEDKKEGKKGGGDKKEEKKGGGDKKEDGPPTAVLKVDMHCEGCARKVKKCVKDMLDSYTHLIFVALHDFCVLGIYVLDIFWFWGVGYIYIQYLLVLGIFLLGIYIHH